MTAARKATIEARRLELSSGPATVYVGGRGDPLLLVHGGWGGAAMHWEAVWARLAERYRVIAPDLPGVGDLSVPTLEGLGAYAGFLAEVLDALGARRAHLVGNSLGAAIAWAFAATYPARTAHLVLVDGGPAPVLPRPMRAMLRLGAVDRLVRWSTRRSTYGPATLGRAFFDPGLAPPELVRLLARREQRLPPVFDLVMRVVRSGERPLPAPTGPVLLLWGEEDRLPGNAVRAARRLKARLPRAEIVLVPDAGHLPQVEQPERVVEALFRFLPSRAEAEARVETP